MKVVSPICFLNIGFSFLFKGCCINGLHVLLIKITFNIQVEEKKHIVAFQHVSSTNAESMDGYILKYCWQKLYNECDL